MLCMSAVSSWTADEHVHDHFNGIGCHTRWSDDQRRVQVLEAEAELRRLRDRVRKAVAQRSADAPVEKPRKRSRLLRHAVAESSVDVRWDVTAEQLVEHMCYWRHTSALACIELTDCLKELTPRSQEPPASRRALTLVWWDMDAKLDEAARDGDAEGERPIVHVTVGDVVPLFVWEVDLLRVRPRTRWLCRSMLEAEMYRYGHRCGTLSERQEAYLRANPVHRLKADVDIWGFCNCKTSHQDEKDAWCRLAGVATARDLAESEARATAARLAILAARRDAGATAASSEPVAAAAAAAVPNSADAVPPRRRRLDESLVTEPDPWEWRDVESE